MARVAHSSSYLLGVLQSSAEQMLHSMLIRVLRWAQQHNVPVDAGAWKQAVTAAGESILPALLTVKTNALLELINGIQHPTVVVWGTSTPEHPCMNALSSSA